MFFKKKQQVEPQYITKDNKLVGVKMGEKEYRIAAYELMMANSPGQKSIYRVGSRKIPCFSMVI